MHNAKVSKQSEEEELEKSWPETKKENIDAKKADVDASGAKGKAVLTSLTSLSTAQ